MRQPERIFLLAALLLLGLPAAASMRCDGGIANTGDRSFEVQRLCGEPDLREPLRITVAGDGTITTAVERWYYNAGPQRLIRTVDFQDGRAQRFAAGDYGYQRFPGSRCRAQQLRRGMTRMELLGDCGPPDAKQTLPPIRPGLAGDGGAFSQTVPAREEWYYDFGSGHLPRIVTLESGRVTRVETGRRTR